MILRRIIALFIDIIIVTIPILLTSWFSNYNLSLILYNIFVLYIIHTSIFIFIMKKTFGEKLISIELIFLNDNKINKFKVFIRNLIFSLFLLIIIISLNDMFDLVISILLFIGLNIVIFLDNNNNQPMTAIDFIFKSYYRHV